MASAIKLDESFLEAQAAPDPSPAPERFVGPDVAAGFIDVTRHQLLCMARTGEIPAHPLRRGKRHQWRFRLSELADWMTQRNLTDDGLGSHNRQGKSPATPKERKISNGAA